MNNDDMEWYEVSLPAYGQEEHMRVIRNAHVIHLGRSGVECLADFEPDQVLLTVNGDWVTCPNCGNELGKTSQLMLRVLDEEPKRGQRTCRTAHLAFLG